MKRLLLFITICWGGVAFGATCEPGFYLEKSECKICNPGHEPFYCPGDDTLYPCPTTDTDYEKLTGWTIIGGRGEAAWASKTDSYGAKTVDNCRSQILFRDSNSNQFLAECPFNGENYLCNPRHWYVAGPGYYLADYFFTSSYPWYFGVKACTNAPANAHYTGPGTPDAPDGSMTDANDCPWECDAGLGNHNGKCMPLCTGGATKIHAGEHVFNIWRDRHTAPSLNVELSGGTVCYINLAPGGAKGTLNVSLRDTTYHVVN